MRTSFKSRKTDAICLSHCIMLSDNCSKYSSQTFINIQSGQFTVSHTRQTLRGAEGERVVWKSI